MEYTIRQITNKDKYEEFIGKTSPYSLFQSWAWGLVQQKLGRPLFRFGMYDGFRLVSLSQVTHIKAKRGSFLHIRHGPIIKNTLFLQVMKLWSNYYRSLGKQKKSLFIRISPLIENSFKHSKVLSSLGYLRAPIHETDAEVCWVLDIQKSDEELLHNMRKSTRYDINRAPKLGIQVVRSAKEDAVKDFLLLYEETAKRQRFVKHEGVREEYEVFSKEGNADVFLAYYQKNLVAGAVILYYKNQAIYHHGASRWSKVSASHYLQWCAIKEARWRGKTIYNFWGIAPEGMKRHPWQGITLFKKGFGGREVQYLHAHDMPLSPLYIIPKIIETGRRMLKGY